MSTEIQVKIDSFSLEWFSRVLAENQEPILSNYYLGSDIYRLTWLRSFHQSVVIRIVREKQRFTIETKWLQWVENESHSTKRDITAEIVGELQNMLVKYNFYSSESFDWEFPRSDGSEWILEVHTKDRYHFLNEWSPVVGRSNGLREIGEYMINNSDTWKEKIY